MTHLSATRACLTLLLSSLACCSNQKGMQSSEPTKEFGEPLIIAAIGDAGETGRELSANARYITDMYTGRHDGGKYDALLFLGDNFYNTGLNVPKEDVAGKIKSVLGPYRTAFLGLGRSNVHAIAGNHDYYARNALEKSFFFGLFNISEGPVGLSDRGNEREREIEWWTYYYNMPASVCYAVSAGSQDSVQFIFVDSALPLRTDTSTWHMALDSLRNLLVVSRDRPGIKWRILTMHHPMYSVGEHAGYVVWDDEDTTVAYLTQCDKDSNALGWVKNWLDPEDLCAAKYRQYMDSLKSTIKAGGAKIHLALTGHDHSLQLLHYPEKDGDCETCPKIHVISGAGSRPTHVKFPSPPREYTSAQRQPSKEGYSVAGFTQLRFENNSLRVVFYDANDGSLIDMGGGKKEFWIDANGSLVH